MPDGLFKFGHNPPDKAKAAMANIHTKAGEEYGEFMNHADHELKAIHH